MIQKFTFFDGGTIEFEDTKSVKELIEYAFDVFDYYEPLGMEKVTLFQAHHPKTSTGWFTTDVDLKCVDEIKNMRELCFAYYMPGVFYYAEGGWGHHMSELGNHPNIPNAVRLRLRFEDFDNTIVINGSYSFGDIITILQSTGYISSNISHIRVVLVGCTRENYSIPISDEIINSCLTKFLEKIQICSEKIQAEQDEYIYYEIFEIV